MCREGGVGCKLTTVVPLGKSGKTTSSLGQIEKQDQREDRENKWGRKRQGLRVQKTRRYHMGNFSGLSRICGVHQEIRKAFLIVSFVRVPGKNESQKGNPKKVQAI